MIDGLLITKSLEKLMAKAGRYDPDEATASDRLPVTMRDLIEFNFEGMVGMGDDVDYDQREINWSKHGQLMLSHLPILAEDLNRKIGDTPAGEKGEVSSDYRGEAPILAAFYRWLEINEPDHGIDVDHRLDSYGKIWPLWGHFFDVLLEKTGYDSETVFSYLYEMEQNMGEPQVWDCGFLPLYDIGAGDNDVPLLEYLNEFVGYSGKTAMKDMPEFPQAVYELEGENCKHSRVVEGSRLVFRNVLLAGRCELLDEKWAAALAGLDEYDTGDIHYHDWWDETMVSVDGRANDIDKLFSKLTRIRKMREAVDPLVDEYMKNSGKFWKELLEKLHVIEIECPSLAANIRGQARPLIEVLA